MAGHLHFVRLNSPQFPISSKVTAEPTVKIGTLPSCIKNWPIYLQVLQLFLSKCEFV